MAYQMHMGFDNPFRLTHDTHLLDYRGVRFKLVQNHDESRADSLFCIVPSPDSDEAVEAYSAIDEWVACLAWRYDVGMAVRPCGGLGVEDSTDLASARPRAFTFPTIAHRGNHTGHGVEAVGYVADAAQARALQIYREGLAANKDALAVLYHWQILELRQGPPAEVAQSIIDRTPNEILRGGNALDALGVAQADLGDFLEEHGRHAVAHLRRTPGRADDLPFGDLTTVWRLQRISRLARRIARVFIRDEMGVDSERFLGARDDKGFRAYG